MRINSAKGEIMAQPIDPFQDSIQNIRNSLRAGHRDLEKVAHNLKTAAAAREKPADPAVPRITHALVSSTSQVELEFTTRKLARLESDLLQANNDLEASRRETIKLRNHAASAQESTKADAHKVRELLARINILENDRMNNASKVESVKRDLTRSEKRNQDTLRKQSKFTAQNNILEAELAAAKEECQENLASSSAPSVRSTGDPVEIGRLKEVSKRLQAELTKERAIIAGMKGKRQDLDFYGSYPYMTKFSSFIGTGD